LDDRGSHFYNSPGKQQTELVITTGSALTIELQVANSIVVTNNKKPSTFLSILGIGISIKITVHKLILSFKSESALI